MKNYKIEECDKECQVVISSDKTCISKAKTLAGTGEPVFVEVDFQALGLGETLYGKTKEESIKRQRENCKKFKAVYKLTKKVVRVLRKANFNDTLYVKNLKEKKNNNDFMLVSMLNILAAKPQRKFKLAYEAACDFLDMENSLNNMCDFKDNRCAKHREKGIDKNTGCCANFCKLRVPCTVCPHKNLSCKIFMCDYLIKEKGFYFTPNTVPVLRKYFTPFERFACFGLLCRTEKKSLGALRGIRLLELFYILLVCGIILLLCL